MNLRGRRKSCSNGNGRHSLVNAHSRREPGNFINVGPRKLTQQRTRLDRHAFQVSSLSFREQSVKRQRTLPDPLTPVITTSLPEGRSTSMLRRLCVLAPRIRIHPASSVDTPTPLRIWTGHSQTIFMASIGESVDSPLPADESQQRRESSAVTCTLLWMAAFGRQGFSSLSTAEGDHPTLR